MYKYNLFRNILVICKMKTYRCYTTFTMLFICLLLGGCVANDESSEAGGVPEAAPIAELISKAEGLFKQREDLDKLREAIALLKRARNSDPQSYEAAWKLSKFSYFLGKNTTDDKESEKALKEGASAGRVAANLGKEKPDGHFWLGANLGEQAKRSPITKGLTAVGDIKEAMNKVISLQPDYQGASAYLALGQVEMATRLTGGSNEKAIEYLEKALEIEKANSYIYVALAEAYLAAKQDAKAKKHLEFVLAKKPDPDFMPEYRESIEKARKLLETRF